MKKRKKTRRSGNGVLMQGAHAAGCEAFWDSVYEYVAKMSEDPEARREFNRAAIRVFEAIIKRLKAEIQETGKPQR
ncbi:MAG: hypothetical protein HY721_08795 [Planctomycetes bacterium]|nr:hypothetical protein [Planctomycetota bacterium]